MLRSEWGLQPKHERFILESEKGVVNLYMEKNNPVQTKAAKSAHRRKKVTIGVIAILIALIAAGAAYLLTQQKKAAPADQPSFNSTNSKATDLADNGDYGGQIQQYKDYLATNPSTTDKAKAMMQIAAAQANDGKYDEAIASYNEVVKLDASYKLAVAHGLANVYIIKGDNQKAIDQLKEAIAITKAQGGTDTDIRIANDESAIKGLEKGLNK